MGKKFIAQVTCDMTGEALDENTPETVIFVNGTMATLFLSDAAKTKLDRALAPFFKNAEITENVTPVLRRQSVTGSSGNANSTHPELSDVDPAEIRAWADKNGFDVAPQGRIRNEVLNAYVERVIRAGSDTPAEDAPAA